MNDLTSKGTGRGLRKECGRVAWLVRTKALAAESQALGARNALMRSILVSIQLRFRRRSALRLEIHDLASTMWPPETGHQKRPGGMPNAQRLCGGLLPSISGGHWVYGQGHGPSRALGMLEGEAQATARVVAL
jgi:hypothetical protein